MRMIVEAFKDTLELGLEKSEQIVVSIMYDLYYPRHPNSESAFRSIVVR